MPPKLTILALNESHKPGGYCKVVGFMGCIVGVFIKQYKVASVKSRNSKWTLKSKENGVFVQF